MWITGHTALAYLVVRSGFSLAGKKPGAGLLLMVFIFGNILDALHFGWLRNFTHNPFGTILFPLLWAYIFHWTGHLRKEDFPIVIGASVVHAAGDLVFGGYLPFFPFSWNVYMYDVWNSPANLIFESVVTVLFLAVLLWTGDWRALMEFGQEERRLFFERFAWRRPVQRALLNSYLFIAFYLLIIGQFVYYLLWKKLGELLAPNMLVWLFLATFVLFILAISCLAFGKAATHGNGQVAR